MSDTFHPRPAAHWRLTRVRGASIALTGDGLRLAVPAAGAQRYANAQIDDYTGLARSRFPWRPPLRLTVRARMVGLHAGTAGFGFWNSPISPIGRVLPVLPAALWFFFAAPPSNMPLADGVPGFGWKAAGLDATTPGALLWAPFAPPVLLLNRIPELRRWIWPRVQRALRISEALLPPPDETWHTYTLAWQPDRAEFAIDGVTLHVIRQPPQGPLGFVAWVDNQWMVATPEGRFGWGLRAVTQPQWLDLREVQIE
jgi:hypothetical protein